MGGEDSKPEAQAPQNTQLPEGVDPNDENHFYLEELQKMSLNGRKEVFYYWIDPRVYNAENQKYFNQFLQHFHIDSFTSTEGLKTELMEIQNEQLIKVITAASLPDDEYRQLNEDKKIAEMFLFCGNEERAKLLEQNFPKIKGYGLKCHQLIDCLKKFE